MIGTMTAVFALILSSACAEGNMPEPVRAAASDLAERLGVPEAEIAVAGFEEVTWPDTSLGVREPGQMYAQVLTPGYRVTLRIGEDRYVYHTDRHTQVVLAQAPETRPETDTAADQTALLLAMSTRAREHLAERLGIDTDDVFLASIEETTWPDAALGRPEPDQAYAQVETPGYLIMLEFEGGIEAYHADREGRIVAPDGTRIAVDPVAVAPPEHPEVVQQAIDDLAARQHRSPGEISVVEVEEVQWPDGALGLPEPGMMYTQAIVEGHRILLSVDDRTFAYHEGGGRVNYAGLVWDEDARPFLLALQEAEQTDGNNRHHLQRIDPHTQESETVAEFISSFTATPDGETVLLKTRRSRSAHSLELMDADGERTELATAFDFTDIAIRPDGHYVASWELSSVQERRPILQIRRYPWGPDDQVRVELPGVQADRRTPASLAWTDDGVAVSVVTSEGPQSFYVTPEGETKQLGEYEVLGRIPRTRALLVAHATEDGAQQLSTLIPGQPDVVRLATAPRIRAVTAPYDDRYVVAALDDGEGLVSILRVDWSASAMPMTEYRDIEQIAISVAPVGNLLALTARVDETPSTQVLQMPRLSSLITIEEQGPAQLIAY